MTEIVPIVPEEDGNTNSSSTSKKQISTAKCWCFTWNNYKSEDIVPLIQVLQEECQDYVFQEEKGTNGTKHLQGALTFLARNRPSALKLPKQIHWEITRNIKAAYKYCQKIDTRDGGVWIWPEPPKPIITIQPTQFYTWQTELLDILKGEPHERKIHWRWESVGNAGKSAFTKYCVVHLKAAFCVQGSYSDLCNIIFNTDMERNNAIVIFDLPRNNGNTISYSALESIKNGLIANTKYETGYKAFNTPHVVVFSNAEPDINKLSNDRWDIKKIMGIEGDSQETG